MLYNPRRVLESHEEREEGSRQNAGHIGREKVSVLNPGWDQQDYECECGQPTWITAGQRTRCSSPQINALTADYRYTVAGRSSTTRRDLVDAWVVPSLAKLRPHWRNRPVIEVRFTLPERRPRQSQLTLSVRLCTNEVAVVAMRPARVRIYSNSAEVSAETKAARDCDIMTRRPGCTPRLNPYRREFISTNTFHVRAKESAGVEYVQTY